MKRLRVLPVVLLAAALVGCGTATETSYPAPPQDYSGLGLTQAEAAGLLTLTQVDDYPLYTMHHYAEYEYQEYEGPPSATATLTWGCSLFAALADPDARVYGRNFDWAFSPAVLLFTDPPDGYASVSMVDIAYLGFGGRLAEGLADMPIEELAPLLDAPYIPFDGLNAAGLAIGMAAVAPGNMEYDPSKPTVGSLGMIRVVLDKASSVDEAIRLMASYNIDFEGGPPIHYLIADARGDSALIEYYEGEMHVIRSETAWHQATNFIRSAVETPEGHCTRHDAMAAELEASNGAMDLDSSLVLLERVAQLETQWSVVYDMSSGEIRVAMGKDYSRIHEFTLEMD